ncbi:MAG: peptidoglycan DD-metalloendopeptidase family protein [Anaerolineae bacterium]|nr:peptidoglycan DD-metalloendopeptidase family protein [Anaerolineae bacterium]
MYLLKIITCIALGLLIASCSSGAAESTPSTTEPASSTPTSVVTPFPTAALAASATPIQRSSPTALQLAVFSPTPPITETSVPTETTVQGTAPQATELASSPTIVPSPTSRPVIDTYWLSRPVSRKDDPDRIDYIDRTYPYGGTQFGTREVHLGVEFVNPRYTPVLAAADGIVLFAGLDDDTQIGPVLNYYGNVVVIQHQFLGIEDALFTVYGHLQEILVETGQTVSVGERIGRVGDSGIAIGPHLHFEVRVAEGLDYHSTRNPALWIAPYPQFGTLAGILSAGTEDAALGRTILVRDEDHTWETYTYGSDRVNGSELWHENFVLPDLPVGEYEVIVSNENGRNLFRDTVEIRNGGTTFVEINIEE